MANISSSNSLGERVPKLRFPEFEGEWDSSPMGALGTFTKGAPLSKADVTETGTPLILYGELYTTYGDIANTIVRKTDKDVKSECYSMLGDVIIPTSGESPEEISTCTCVMQDGVILAGDLNIYRTNDLDGRFLSYEINHVRNREIAKIAQGKSIVHIKADELAKIVIRFPSKAEQSKIIELFSCLDRKIELQKELIESLKLYKRGLLSKLFPQKGESVPQYRFTGFTDAWEQRKLYEFGRATGGTSIESEFSDEGSYKVISIGSYSEDSVYRDQGIRAIKSEKTLNRVLNKGDITMILNDKTASGNIIGRVLLIEESGGYVYNQRTERIELDNENYDSQFIYTMLNAPEIRDKIIKQSQGNTQIYVNWTTISQTEYLVPQIKEQQRIGDYFAALDRLLTLHQRKQDFCEKVKLALLQQMFI